MNTLAQRLKALRKEAGLTQAELAKRTDCSQASIAHVEVGMRMSMQNIATVAKVLNVDAYWLETGKGVMRSQKHDYESEDEKELLQAYRLMSDEGKRHALSAVAAFSAGFRKMDILSGTDN